MRPLALAALSLLPYPPADVVSIAGAAGFRSVGLRLVATPGGVDHQLLGNSPARRATVRALRTCGVSTLDVEVFRLLPPDQGAMPPAEPVFEAAAELGARYAVVISYDTDTGRAADRLAALCRLADGYRMACVVEFMGFIAVRTIDAALDLVERSGAANAGVLVDPLHLIRTGGSAADIHHVPRSRLMFAQFCDARHGRPEPDPAAARAEAVADRLPPGQGALPLREILGALPPDIPLSVEVPPAAGASPVDHAARLYAAAAAFAARTATGP